MDTIFWEYALPCVCAFWACVGFTLMFNIHGLGKLIAGVGGALGWLVYLPWVLALLRMFSTRLEQRYQENRRFVQWWQGLKAKLQGLRRPGAAQPGAAAAHGRTKNGPYVADSAAYHHFACPACGQKLRVPKGRGKVVVTCPKCGREFIERA